MDVFMSHDVDWPKSGPGEAHVLARRDRFDEALIERVTREKFNPYFGIPRVAEIEKEFGVRSTFFFRPKYDDGQTVGVYRDELRMLRDCGWEVGLHVNDAGSLGSLVEEKRELEAALGAGVVGSRAHYLRMSAEQMKYLPEAGILYDSSVMYSKDRFDPRSTGYESREGGLVVFPITFMDSYLFTYSNLKEDDVVAHILSNLARASDSNVKLATILWHDNAIFMRGGRVYRSLLEKLVATEGLTVVRGIDAYNSVSADSRIKR